MLELTRKVALVLLVLHGRACARIASRLECLRFIQLPAPSVSALSPASAGALAGACRCGVPFNVAKLELDLGALATRPGHADLALRESTDVVVACRRSDSRLTAFIVVRVRLVGNADVGKVLVALAVEINAAHADRLGLAVQRVFVVLVGRGTGGNESALVRPLGHLELHAVVCAGTGVWSCRRRWC